MQVKVAIAIKDLNLVVIIIILLDIVFFINITASRHHVTSYEMTTCFLKAAEHISKYITGYGE